MTLSLPLRFGDDVLDCLVTFTPYGPTRGLRENGLALEPDEDVYIEITSITSDGVEVPSLTEEQTRHVEFFCLAHVEEHKHDHLIP